MPPPPLIALRGATLGFGGRPLFAGLDVALAPGDRACLVGRNGSGKSTLLMALAGQVELDAGARFLQPGTRIGYLPQTADLSGFATVLDYVAAGLPPDQAGETFRAEAALAPLGLDPGRDPRPLSGGEARRAALARALAADPEVLLLDEPTNHLDLPAIEGLEQTLAGFRGALLVVSHDRTFLSRVSNRTLWLDRGRLLVRDHGFAGFDEWAEAVYAAEERAEARLDKRIAAETHWLREGLTARRRRNQGRVRALQQMRADRREHQGRQGTAKLDPAEATAGGRLVIEAEDIAKRFPGSDGTGETVIVCGFSSRIQRGDRIGVIGPNGAGKTTLVRILIGDIPPDRGTVRLGANIEPAYFDQRRAALDPETSLRRVLDPAGGEQVFVGGRPRHVAGYLRDFLFDPARLDSPVKSLSGGERNRLLLARLFARPSNLLVLDEPTNDLDMDTLDLLEDVLGDYGGTLILVSHDRDFLDRLVTSVIAVEGGGDVAEYVGGYSDYARQRPAAPPSATAPSAAPPSAAGPSATAPSAAGRAKETAPRPRTAPRKLGYKQQRELDELPGRIEALTAEAAALEAALADAELYTRAPNVFAAKTSRLNAVQAELAAAEERWLELAELAERLGSA